jgi:hypothetical protein
MATLLQPSPSEFMRRYLVARASFQPSDYGIQMEKAEFVDLMAEEFNKAFKGQLTVDEVLLRPRVAMQFCDAVRLSHGWFDLPDDSILRSVLQRRKNP